MFKRYKHPFDTDKPANGTLEREASSAVHSQPGHALTSPYTPPYSQKSNVSPSSSDQYPYRNGAPQGRAIPPRIFESDPDTVSSIPDSLPQSKEESVEGMDHLEEPFVPFGNDEPETTLGEGVVFKGSLTFKRWLRIDGIFEGELNSDGKLVVGPTGMVKSDLKLREAIIEGTVEGDITVEERLELRGEAKVTGNIVAKSISVDEGVTLVGHVEVTPN